MTQDEKQLKAISLFQDGEFEEAIATMAQSETIGDKEYKQFVEQCKSCLVEQYLYLINEAISDKDYGKAITYKDEFISKFGNDRRIADIKIDYQDSKDKDECTTSSEAPVQSGSRTAESNDSNIQSERKSSAHIWFLVCLISIFILFAIISVCLRGCQDSGSMYWGDNVEASYPCDSAEAVDNVETASDYTIENSTSTESEEVENVPNISGEWEETGQGFGLLLTLIHSTITHKVEVKECWVYRLDGWDVQGYIEKGKLILDDGRGNFHAEFEISENRLSGRCKAKGDYTDFDGNLTLKRADTDNALTKLYNSSGGTYRYEQIVSEEYDNGVATGSEGIQIALKGGPQIAQVKMWCQDYWEISGEYQINQYDIVISFDEGCQPLKGRFAKDMSSLTINNYNGKRVVLKRIGDFEW